MAHELSREITSPYVTMNDLALPPLNSGLFPSRTRTAPWEVGCRQVLVVPEEFTIAEGANPRRHKDDGMICMVELDAISVDETDGDVGMEGKDGKLSQEIPPNPNICIPPLFGPICPRSRESPFDIGTARS
jgi:hypothetical protein